MYNWKRGKDGQVSAAVTPPPALLPAQSPSGLTFISFYTSSDSCQFIPIYPHFTPTSPFPLARGVLLFQEKIKIKVKYINK